MKKFLVGFPLLLITVSQATVRQKIIPGFSEFSVACRCGVQGLLWQRQLEKEAQERERDQRGETASPQPARPSVRFPITSQPACCLVNTVATWRQRRASLLFL